MQTVKQIRMCLGYKQNQMAKLLGISSNTYRSKEKGIKCWTVYEVARIIKVSGKSVNEICILH